MLSAILSGAGSLLNVFGAIGSKNAAIENQRRITDFNARQSADFAKTSENLLSQANKMSTFKSDISGFEKAQSLAEMQARTAGSAPVAGQNIAEENIRKSMANVIGTMGRSARSSTDILTSILAGTEGTNEALRGIGANAMEIRANQRSQANQNVLSASQATASAAERGNIQEFESLANKERTSLSLNQNLAQARLNMQQQQFEAERNAINDVARAKAAIWSGFGGMLGAAGQGVAQTEMMRSNQDFLKGLANPNGGAGTSTSNLLNMANQLGIGMGQGGSQSYFGQYTTVGGGTPLSLFKR